ncbi:MAG: hypothetical protein Q8T04_13905, partial [Bacteroidota bacterium]|nr:hypothetical protein [Bacteroidota bacterium]
MKTDLTKLIIRKKTVLICLSMVMLFPLSEAIGITTPYNKKELLSVLIKLNDNSITNVLNRQWTDKNSVYYGAAFDGDSVVSPIQTSYLIENLMCSYVSPESKYYQSKEILHRMTLAASGLLNLQHDDGTIDLISTNFHSTPDLGFTIYPLALAYSIMLKNKQLNYG